jgi:lipopolysaccharide export system permease protein
MPGSILNRLIFWELVKVFLLSLVSLTGLFVTAGLVQQASQLGLSLSQVVAAVPLFVPSMLPYTIPATTLFASCVVYGRLAHDNEIVAIKAAGVHLFTILKPALLLGVLTTAATAALYHTVIPTTQQLLQKQILDDPEEMLYGMLRRERCIRFGTFPYVIYVKDVQGRRLVDVVLKRRVRVKNPVTGTEAFDGYDFVARAREARLRVDVAEGTLYIEPDRFVIDDKTTRGTQASNVPVPVGLPENVTGKDIRTRPQSLTWEDIPARLAELRERLAEAERKRDASRAESAAAADDGARAKHLQQEQHLKAQATDAFRQLRNVESEFYMRPALAVGCLVFAVIGCPVGIMANRSDYLSSFVVCFLPTVIVYYPLLLFGGNAGRAGTIPLGLAVWLANVVVGAAGLVLTARLLRR